MVIPGRQQDECPLREGDPHFEAKNLVLVAALVNHGERYIIGISDPPYIWNIGEISPDSTTVIYVQLYNIIYIYIFP